MNIISQTLKNIQCRRIGEGQNEREFYDFTYKIFSDGSVEILKYNQEKEVKINKNGRGADGMKENKNLYQQQVAWRAGTKVREKVLENNLKYLWTLTFSDEIVCRDYALREFNLFIKRLKYHFSLEKLDYIAVIEIQKKRAKKTGKNVLHFHFSTNVWLDQKKLKTVWSNGFVYVSEFSDDIQKVASYMAKYLKKDMLEKHEPDKKSYLSSKGLNVPQKGKGILSIEMIGKIAETNNSCHVFENAQWIQIKP